MCCRNFWKKTAIFCLAFGLGVLIWSFYDFRGNLSDKTKASNLNNRDISSNKRIAFEAYRKKLIIDLEKIRDEELNWLEKNRNLPNKAKKNSAALVDYYNHQIKQLEDLDY